MRALKDDKAALEASLEEAQDRAQAAVGKLAAEQEASATLERARAAAVQACALMNRAPVTGAYVPPSEYHTAT